MCGLLDVASPSGTAAVYGGILAVVLFVIICVIVGVILIIRAVIKNRKLRDNIEETAALETPSDKEE